MATPSTVRSTTRARIAGSEGSEAVAPCHRTRPSRSLTFMARTTKSAAATTPTFQGFSETTFRFLRGISQNNSKAWFDENRSDYDEGYVAASRLFVEAIGPRLQAISKGIDYEARINGSIFRIQRDVRFSKDKTPYKNHLDLWFWEGERRGWDTPGFFFRMFEKTMILGAGMHQLNKEHLEAYRQAVLDPKKGKALVSTLNQVQKAGAYTLGAPTRKTVPRGFDASHERAPLLLHEGLWAAYEGPVPKEATTPAFVDWCVHHFQAVWPVGQWLLSALKA